MGSRAEREDAACTTEHLTPPSLLVRQMSSSKALALKIPASKNNGPGRLSPGTWDKDAEAVAGILVLPPLPTCPCRLEAHPPVSLAQKAALELLALGFACTFL